MPHTSVDSATAGGGSNVALLVWDTRGSAGVEVEAASGVGESSAMGSAVASAEAGLGEGK